MFRTTNHTITALLFLLLCGAAVRVLVDTGASPVAMSSTEA